MTTRYNPQSIEKKTECLSASASPFSSLSADIAFRFSQLNDSPKAIKPVGVFNGVLEAESALIAEYGIDASRFAQIVAQGRKISSELLDSAYKWLSLTHSAFFTEGKAPFNSALWLECLLSAKQSVLKKGYIHGGLAFIRKAKKSFPPSNALSNEQYSLILSAIYPFCPIFAVFHSLRLSAPLLSIRALTASFGRYVCVKFSLKNDVWFYKVFNRIEFENSPTEAFLKIKWVKTAARGKKLTVLKQQEGFLLCLS